MTAVLRSIVARMRPVIHTRKEVVDSTLLVVAAGVTSAVTVAEAVNDYTGAVGDVEVGSVITSLYCFIQMLPTAITENVDFYVIKKPVGVANPTPGAVGGAPQRKYVLHEEKGIPGNANDGAYPLTFKGVVKIPKGRQRMAEDDKILVVLRGVGISNACIKVIYKPKM